MKKIAVVAVGGNSLIVDKDHQTIADQFIQAAKTMHYIIALIKHDYEVVITHGNGPQVGFILLRSDFARGKIHPVPLDICGADTQGSIGYQFQVALTNEFKKQGIDKKVATIVTQVIVDRNDPAFQNPNKPIGSFYSKEEAIERQKEENWTVMEDAGRGWRRTVASPMPKEIIEMPVIKSMIKNGVVTIAAGGGGIPVAYNEKGDLEGVAAVIDKDHASAMLASELKADLFMIFTSVEKVCLNFGKPDQVSIDKMTVKEAKKHIDEKQFSPGSMLPKIEAAIRFLENGGREAVITDFEHLEDALDGKSGTRIIK